jgi:uncharacterized membrane protein
MPATKSLARTAVKTISWRVFAGIDSFVVFSASSVYFGTGDLKLAAASALSAVGLEAITKIGWFFLHERLWDSEFINNLFNREPTDYVPQPSLWPTVGEANPN